MQGHNNMLRMRNDAQAGSLPLLTKNKGGGGGHQKEKKKVNLKHKPWNDDIVELRAQEINRQYTVAAILPPIAYRHTVQPWTLESTTMGQADREKINRKRPEEMVARERQPEDVSK